MSVVDPDRNKQADYENVVVFFSMPNFLDVHNDTVLSMKSVISGNTPIAKVSDGSDIVEPDFDIKSSYQQQVVP